MSSRQLRISLLYLLMLVLPLQVMAAAVMPLCMTSPAHTEHAAGQESQDDHAHGHSIHAATSAEHQPQDHAAEGSHAGCSICASSCHSCGALSSLSLTIPLMPRAETAPGTYQSFNGHIADIPRRPPRTVSL